ncbi:MAG: AraC family transcriptional regulator [Puia sp.]|nr:AraC family transcriptional regulator [Puia sp.]
MPINGLFTPYDYDRINRAIAYIEKHYSDAVSADQLAMEVGMDIKQLQAGVYSRKGLTIHNYILKVRVERATKDLEDFGRPIKFIAAKHGFSSSSHFGAEFKKQTGQTPRQYRYLFALNMCNGYDPSGPGKDLS